MRAQAATIPLLTTSIACLTVRPPVCEQFSFFSRKMERHFRCPMPDEWKEHRFGNSEYLAESNIEFSTLRCEGVVSYYSMFSRRRLNERRCVSSALPLSGSRITRRGLDHEV